MSTSTSSPETKTWTDPSNAYIISGSIAGPLLIFVLYTFIRFKRIRIHPAGLMFARTLADFGFIFSTLLLSGVVEGENENSSQKNICSSWGPLIAFFFMASQFYFIGMCYDLYVTCTYPLRSVAYTARKVHLCSWILSAIITIIFSIVNNNGYKHENTGEICFLGINNNENNKTDRIQEWFTFLGPYIIGILSGIISLIFVFFRLKNGLGEVFEHAQKMVKDQIIHCLLYTILGIAWFILLLSETLNSSGLSFAVSFIIVGTACIDCTIWILQKFKFIKNTNTTPLHLDIKNGSISDITFQDFYYKNSNKLIHNATMSSVLRLELIRNMCSGVTQSLDHFKHNREYIDDNINALHFAPIKTISRKSNKTIINECISNQSIHKFLMASQSSGDQIFFTDYSPHVFKYLRKNCYKENVDLEESVRLALENNSSMEELSAKFSEGKSGAFFFYTVDNKYLIKTLRKSEAITFLKILPGYFEHMRKFPYSFISKFYGLYCIKLYGTHLWFTIMKNIFISNLEPHEKYDIKGSWINRYTKHHIELGKLMKDEDLKKRVLIPYVKSKKAWEQMSHDTRFLNTLNIMDYSLLLGIYYIGISSDTVNNKQLISNSNCNSNPNTYKPPIIDNNVELAIMNNEENDELKQEELKEGDNETHDSDNNNANHNKNNKNNKNNKSELLDLNTMSAMKKDISKLGDKFSPKGKPTTKLRRRAFTAGTGLKQLSSHPQSYQSQMIEGPGFYMMGIIDILQEYNYEKQIERIFKVFVKCVDGYGISCIEPSMYRKRFLAKMLQIGIGRGDK